jgi:DNA polymerase (family X)
MLYIQLMATLDASEVASLLRELGQRTMLAGGNPYRARAYLKAAENLAALAIPLDALISRGALRQIPGVGETIADIIKKLHLTGSHPALEKMRQEIPVGVLDMLTIPGLRADKAVKLYKELGIGSLDQLEAAVKADQIKGIKSLGPALQRKILQGLEIRRNTQGARHIHRAAELLAAAARTLAQSDQGLTEITPAGDFRRGCELVSDLALVAEMSGKGDPHSFKTGELSVHITDKDLLVSRCCSSRGLKRISRSFTGWQRPRVW